MKCFLQLRVSLSVRLDGRFLPAGCIRRPIPSRPALGEAKITAPPSMLVVSMSIQAHETGRVKEKPFQAPLYLLAFWVPQKGELRNRGLRNS